MPEIDIKFQNIFKVAVIALRINATYPFTARSFLWLIHISLVLCINITSFYFLAYSTCVHDIKKKNFTEACKNTTMIIICINTSMKTFVMLYYRYSVIDLIRIVDRDYEQAKQFLPEEQKTIQSYADQGRLVCMAWFVCASSGSLIFPAKACLLTVQSFWIGENQLKPMFDMTFPLVMEKHRNDALVFWGFFALCFSFGFFAATIYTGFDPLIPLFTTHLCGQLDIIGSRISRALSKENSVEDMHEELKMIIIKLQELYRFVDEVQNKFSLLNEFNMKATTVVLPLIGFLVVEDVRRNVVNYEFFIIFLGTALHFLMPCYFSDKLMERSEAFRLSLYTCAWEKQPSLKIRRTILLMLTRATRPLSISTVFYNISLDTFATSMRQAYSIFNLMCAAWRTD